jgi:DNA-binding response OmpR family regulator
VGLAREIEMMALVVQDDNETLEDIIQVFEMCRPDLRLEVSDSGKRCLEMVQGKCPDIVILDKDLPDGGYEVLRQIRLLSQVPVIFLSNTRDEPEIVKALELGADKYMTKPIRQLEFMAHVRALLRQRPMNIQAEGS